MSEPFYVYTDGSSMHIDGDGGRLSMPIETFDELVALRWFRLTAAEQDAAARRAIALHGGHLGADGVRKAYGYETNFDAALRKAKEVEARRLEE
jgi:hypothetical protein